MNVSLHFSAWEGQKVCKRTTREVLSERHVDADGGVFTKHLVPKIELDPVRKAIAAARARFRYLSLAWGEDGLRIISAENFFTFQTAMSEERDKVNGAADTFAGRYPALLAHAPVRMNGLYDPQDFPAPERIRKFFSMRLEISPIPAKEDFRVSLGATAEAAIRENIEQTVSTRLGEAQRELWERLFDTLKHFATKMAEVPSSVPEGGKKQGGFKDTTVENLRSLAKLAPQLSIVADPKLDGLCKGIIGILDGIQADDLRNNMTVRKDTAQSAAAKLAEVERAMQGAF
jgi:hypothetical protein